MKHTILALVAAVGVLSGAVAFPDEIPDPAQTYLLRYAPKAGDSAAYDLVLDGTLDLQGIPGAPTDMDMTMTLGLCLETVSVDPKGTFTTKVVLDKMDLNVMGMDMDLLAMIPGGEKVEFTMVQEPTGKIVRMEGLEKLAGVEGMGDMPGMDKLQQMMNPLTNMSMAVFPDHPVRLWEMWTPEMPEMLAGLFEGSGGQPVRCWLCRIEEIDGQTCAKIRARVIGTLDIGKAIKEVGGENAAFPGMGGMEMNMGLDANAFSWIRLRDGALIKMEGSGDIDINLALGEVDDSVATPAGQMPGKMAVKMHYDLTMDPRPDK